ncbi:MAG: transporter substrate-binding domain-containing protein [Proteobacteria bacterium]|nr:transporter substrate-binding domain-containing protein [Pseudomonadota bacterium]
MYWLRVVICILLAQWSAFSEAASGCSRPLIVASSSISIFMEVDDLDRVSGVVPDFLAEITKTTGCQFIYEVMPRIRALRMLEAGKIDIIAASKIDKRDALADYVNVISERPSLIMLKDHPNAATPLDALMQGKLQVNVVRGFDIGPEYRALLEQLKQKNRLEDVLDTDVIARKMLEKRCDATVVGASTFAKSIEKFNLESKLQVIPMETMPIVYSGFYFSKTSMQEKDRLFLIAEFNSKLKAGKFKEIFMKRVKNMKELYSSVLFEKL